MQILVVDDHPPTVELMRLTLTSFGHSVRTATNVVEALELAASDPPDIVLSDLTFSAKTGPDQDGHALARRLRAGPDHIRPAMMAITGVSSPSELQAALDSGFDEVVTKPFVIESLIERIEALGQAKAER